MKRGGPLKRYQALVAKTPIRRSGWIERKPATQKQKNDRAELDAAKRVIWQRSGGRCEFGMPKDPPWPSFRWSEEAQDPHHISRQSQGHDHSPANLLAVCRVHHRWIHDHVTEARALGYLSPAKRGDL